MRQYGSRLITGLVDSKRGRASQTGAIPVLELITSGETRPFFLEVLMSDTSMETITMLLAPKAKNVWKNKPKPDHRACYSVYYKALRDGTLVREACSFCGSLKVHGHHYDYDKPLAVFWLCAKHHRMMHRGKRFI
jgi:hypothetical protein